MNKERRAPPYVGFASMKRFLDHIRTKQPREINYKLLAGWGVPSTARTPLLTALRYFGLIDDANRPTRKVGLLRAEGDEYMRNLQQLVRSAYADVFAQPDLDISDINQVHSHFQTYRFNKYLTERAVYFFRGIAREAKLLTEERGGESKETPPQVRNEQRDLNFTERRLRLLEKILSLDGTSNLRELDRVLERLERILGSK